MKHFFASVFAILRKPAFRGRSLLLMLSVFAVSVVVRLPHFGLPLGHHHEWLTAHTLIILDNWEEDGITTHKFSPIYSYNNPGDIVDYSLCGLHDDRGKAYYVSYGPFAFLAPYFLLKPFGLATNLNALLTLNLIIHFLISLVLYLTVSKLANKPALDFYLPSLITFTLYVFSPGTLWFHGNVYFSEILVQLFLALGLYYFVLFNVKQSFSAKFLIGFGVICFLGVYTEWMMVFYVFAISVWLFIRQFGHKKYLKPLIIGCICGLSAFLLILFQYSMLAGFNPLIETWTAKYITRSGIHFANNTETVGYFMDSNSWSNLNKQLNLSFINVFNILGILLPFVFVAFIWKKKYNFTSLQIQTISLLLLLVLTHHLVFFEFSCVHDFALLKTGMFFILLTGLLASRLNEFFKINKTIWLIFNLALVILLTEKSYSAYLKYNEQNDVLKVSEIYKKVGLHAHNYAKPHELVFTNAFVSPMINYYAKRNLRYASSESIALSQSHAWKTNSLFIKTNETTCLKIVRYSPQGDSSILYTNKTEVSR